MVDNRPVKIAAYIPELRRYATALLRNSVEAEDLVQECLCRAIARAKPWHMIRDTRAYLFTILHNLYVDRVARKPNGHDVVSDELVQRKLVVKPAQLSRLEIRDLSWALDQLPSEQREVILLVGLEGMSYEDAARVLAIPNGTVMSRLSRGRDALRRLMEGAEDETNEGKANDEKPARVRMLSDVRSRG